MALVQTMSTQQPPATTPIQCPTFAFFQLEMAGGIFQFFWSSWVMGRGGECMMGTGGEPGPRGTLVCLNLGGSRGSTGMSCILTMRWPAPEACAAFWLEGVYLCVYAAPSLGSVDVQGVWRATMGELWAI